MKVTQIALTDYKAHLPDCGNQLVLGTYGSRGREYFKIIKCDDWENLTVSAIFQPSGVEVVVPDNCMLEVPWEATQKALPKYEGTIVFKGVDGNGVLINTLDVNYKVEDHSPYIGTNNQEITPSVEEQLINKIADLEKRVAVLEENS